MRTNCLDCLDRTNVTQTKIAMRILDDILDRIKAHNKKTNPNSSSSRTVGLEGGDSSIFEAAK